MIINSIDRIYHIFADVREKCLYFMSLNIIQLSAEVMYNIDDVSNNTRPVVLLKHNADNVS